MLARSQTVPIPSPLNAFTSLKDSPSLAALSPDLLAAGSRILALPAGALLRGNDTDAAHILALACEHIAQTNPSARAYALPSAFGFRSRLPFPAETNSYDADVARLHGLALGLAAGDWAAVCAWQQQCPPAPWTTEGLLWPRQALRALVLTWDALVGESPESVRAGGAMLEQLVVTFPQRLDAYLATLDAADQQFAKTRLYALECALVATDRVVRRILQERVRHMTTVSTDELWEQAQLITPDAPMETIYLWLREASWGGVGGGLLG